MTEVMWDHESCVFIVKQPLLPDSHRKRLRTLADFLPHFLTYHHR